MRRFRLLVLLSLLALSATGVLAHPAAAIEPTREPIDDTIISEVTDICSFPVTITATIVGTETTFYDQNGEVTRGALKGSTQQPPRAYQQGSGTQGSFAAWC
jgi:hypothetical protein